jgi:lipid-A-disaccharide synthase
MTIFFSVGEPSGDLHGANLVRALLARRADVSCVGYGGPKMAAAGARLHADLTKLAVMWFARVLVNLHKFWALYRRAKKYFRDVRPDAVVLIDYPGFNWWIARAAKAHGIPVFYYGTPQIWAWASWRVRKMRRLVDHVLCKLPFEPAWFAARGVRATFVGHPYFDELAREAEVRGQGTGDRRQETEDRVRRRLVTILPGSRMQEVTANLPMMLRAARRVQERCPDVELAVASFNPQQAEVAEELVGKSGVRASVYVGRTGELICEAICAMAVSGSVSLELLYHATPAVVVYKVSRAAFFLQRFFRKVRYITLANLVAAHDPFVLPSGTYEADNPIDAEAPLPEYLTSRDVSERVAGHLVRWLTDSLAREKVRHQLLAARQKIASVGASERAADYILGKLAGAVDDSVASAA